MAHGRSASRHGRYDALRTEFSTMDNVPAQPVFSYDRIEGVKQAKEKSTVSRQHSTPTPQTVGLDSESSEPPRNAQASHLSWWPKRISSGSPSVPPSTPQPPSTPRASDNKRKSFSDQRPSSSQSRRSHNSRRFSFDHDQGSLASVTSLRPPSSLGKYQVLPSIGTNSTFMSQDIDNINLDNGLSDQAVTIRSPDQTLLEAIHTKSTEESHKHFRPDASEGPSSQDLSEHLDLLANFGNISLKKGEKKFVSFPSPDSLPLDVNSNSAASTNTSLEFPDPGDDRCYTSLSQYQIDEVHSPICEGQVLLGIKIPTNGTRYKQPFNTQDQLRCIIHFAEEVSGDDFSNHVLVLAVPQKRFEDLSLTIEAAGLESKSVIHLEEAE